MQEFELVRYEEAKRALAACASIDEVKDIQDKAEAMRLYAKMSEDKELECYSSTIKLRAQIKLGEMIASMEVPPGGTITKKKLLEDAKIPKTSAHRYEKAASRIPEPALEEYIKENSDEKKPVSLTALLSKTNLEPPHNKKVPLGGTIPPQTDESPGMITIRQIEYDQMRQDLRAALDDNERLTKIMGADDKVAELLSLNKEMAQRLEICLRSNIAVTNECNEAKKAAKKWKALYEKEVKNDKPPAKTLCIDCRKSICICRQPGEEG